MELESLDLFRLEDRLWIASFPTGSPAYDFDFDRFFACRRPWERPAELTAIGRFGAVSDYEKTFLELRQAGVALINTPEEHHRASELTGWFDLLRDFTPRSRWYDHMPAAEEVERDFTWPVFIKGSRQTSGHRKDLSIATDRSEFQRIVGHFNQDPILHWQTFVVREYAPLRPVEGGLPTDVPASFEFRTFWYRGGLVGAGRYWNSARPYDWSEGEKSDALGVAAEAVKRLNVPFLVVDLAQTVTGRWIIIECNDAQEAGYAAISPFALWREMLAVGESP